MCDELTTNVSNKHKDLEVMGKFFNLCGAATSVITLTNPV